MTAREKLVQFLHSHKMIAELPDPKELSKWEYEPIYSLSKKGLLDEQQTVSAIAKILSLDSIDLSDSKVKETLTIDELESSLSSDLCWKHKLLPLYSKDNNLTVAIVNPLDPDGPNTAAFATSKKIELKLALESQVLPLLAEHFPHSNFRFLHGLENSEHPRVKVIGDMSEVTDVTKVDISIPPVIRLTNKIIADAVASQASDIHLEPMDTHVDVRFRIDGMMHEIIKVPRTIQSPIVARFKVMAGMDISERRRPQDGRLRVKVGNKYLNLRLSTIPTTFGEKLVVRVLQNDYDSLNLKSQGVTPELEEKLMSVLDHRGKLLLVSGPTGSGKTTTLYCCLNAIRNGKCNITTIEDPIEYRLPGINQIQVNKGADVTFASALRSVLRQDPDVIMIGEIRDSETLSIALQAAQTGHLVLSTIHTNDAPSAVSRLLTLDADAYLVSTGLAGILAQRLVRRVCEHCKKPISKTSISTYQEFIKKYQLNPDNLVEASGCTECFHSGYRGRIGFFSYLAITDELAELIFLGSSREALIRAARKNGFRQLDEVAVDLVNDGTTTLQEVKSYLVECARPPESSSVMPSTSAPVATISSSAAETPQPNTKTAKQSPCVLVVDDNAVARKMVCALLKRDRVTVVQAENGEDALEKISQHSPSIILCDISMPKMDGREFLELLKTNKQTRDIPVIILTSDDCEHTEIDLLKLGAREFISKKSSPLVIIGRLRNVLNSI